MLPVHIVAEVVSCAVSSREISLVIFPKRKNYIGQIGFLLYYVLCMLQQSNNNNNNKNALKGGHSKEGIQINFQISGKKKHSCIH